MTGLDRDLFSRCAVVDEEEPNEADRLPTERQGQGMRTRHHDLCTSLVSFSHRERQAEKPRPVQSQLLDLLPRCPTLMPLLGDST